MTLVLYFFRGWRSGWRILTRNISKYADIIKSQTQRTKKYLPRVTVPINISIDEQLSALHRTALVIRHPDAAQWRTDRRNSITALFTEKNADEVVLDFLERFRQVRAELVHHVRQHVVIQCPDARRNTLQHTDTHSLYSITTRLFVGRQQAAFSRRVEIAKHD